MRGRALIVAERMRAEDNDLLLERLITVSISEREAAQTTRWIHLHLYLVPLRFALNVCWIKSDRVLMSKLQRDARADLHQLRFVVSVWEEGAPSGHPSNLFKHRTPKSRQRVARRV